MTGSIDYWIKKLSFKTAGYFCIAIAILLFYYTYYLFLFEKPDLIILLLGISFVFLGLMSLLFNTDKEMAIAFLIVAILIISGCLGTYFKYTQEMDKEIKTSDMRFKAHMEQWSWEQECMEKAIATYNVYKNDLEIMNVFYNIRSIHPFLKQQMIPLREYMKNLTKNITVDNYDLAFKQFSLCYTMNIDYSSDYTFYFNRFNKLYKNLSFVNYKSIPYSVGSEFEVEGEDFFLFAIKDDLDSNHDDGFEILWFSDELEYIKSQLEYTEKLVDFEVNI
ncbi:MAG: hypothetical protein AMJ90_06845 [candidate division Zixibacteria bacterium SM23_73_2]|nr:MAG: hypothetical protein AMJ90_06845 [candidate division Zixibacteria bacterium SM23_73_2]